MIEPCTFTRSTVAAGSQPVVPDGSLIRVHSSRRSTIVTSTPAGSCVDSAGGTFALSSAAEVAGLLLAGDARADVGDSLLVRGGDYGDIRGKIRDGAIMSSATADDPDQAHALGILNRIDGVMVKYAKMSAITKTLSIESESSMI